MSLHTSVGCINATNSSQAGNQSCTEPPLKYYYEYKEFEIYRLFVENSYLLVTVPAIPLNLLCIFAVSLMRPFNSSCIYMLVLSWTDLLCVVCRLIYGRIDMASSEFLCKYFKYLSINSNVYSNFVLICFTIERAVATTVPLKAGQICTKRNATISLTISLILCLGLNIVYLTGSFISYKDVNGVRMAVCTLTRFAGNKWVKVYLSYHNLTPLIIVAVCNSVIIYNIKKAQERKRVLTNGTHADTQRGATRTLLVLAMMFAILHLPYALFNLSVPDFPTASEIPSFDQQLMARLLLVGNIVYQIMCLQNGINFFLYCSTSSKFRNALYNNRVTRLLWPRITCCRINKPNNINGMTPNTSMTVPHVTKSYSDLTKSSVMNSRSSSMLST